MKAVKAVVNFLRITVKYSLIITAFIKAINVFIEELEKDGIVKKEA